ncbi:MAG TPA: hypothetical protein VLH79_13110 [Chthonomonadales bacterium]|nr:hypothetical protein [Chthonomonadales bacterium]
MLDARGLGFLQTPEGVACVAEAERLGGELLHRIATMRRRHAAERSGAALALVELRRRAAARFELADRMLFTSVGLEQASGSVAARWRASRFPQGVTVADLCCGIGGDTMELARRGSVLAFDTDLACCLCARANASLVAPHGVSVARADVANLRLREAYLVADPSRRLGARRFLSGDDYSPPLSAMHQIAASAEAAALKLSPAIPDVELDALGARVEFVSVGRECREAVAWYGSAGPSARRSAAVLPEGAVLEQREEATPPVRGPSDWILEPDPAVIRAHLVRELAGDLGAALLDPRVAILTMDRPVATPFARAFRLIDAMPLHLRRLQRRLAHLDAGVSAVKCRAAPVDSEALLRALPRRGERSVVVIATRVGERVVALICEAPGLRQTDAEGAP